MQLPAAKTALVVTVLLLVSNILATNETRADVNPFDPSMLYSCYAEGGLHPLNAVVNGAPGRGYYLPEYNRSTSVMLGECPGLGSDDVIRQLSSLPWIASYTLTTVQEYATCHPNDWLGSNRCEVVWSIYADITGIRGNSWRERYVFAAVRWFFVQEQYIIRLSAFQSDPGSSSELTSIEPGHTASLLARVYDKNNQLVPNVGVRLTLEAKKGSGGHHHGDDTVPARTGTMNGQQVLTGNTGPGGLQFSYKAPGVSGDYKITATCTDGKNCKQEGPDTVWVGVKKLQPLQTDSSYVLISPNADQHHPNNHYVTEATQEKIQGLAADYHISFPSDPLLHLNDASLVRGGLFDLTANWSDQPRGHKTHRFGTDIDVRANEFYHEPNESIPVNNYVDLMAIVRKHRCDAQIHSGATSNEHIHLYCR